MKGLVLVYTLFGTADEAGAVCRQLVEEKLAGCANILSPCTSLYEWEGAMREDREVPALLKTTAAALDRLKARLTELHGYDVPAILSWPADANEGYACWIGEQLKSD